MIICKTLLGGIVALVIAGSAFADPAIRPFSRNDATVAGVAVAEVALAAYRPAARPAPMIRYPVEANLTVPTMRPLRRSAFLPRTRWDFKDGSDVWTRAAMVAVGAYGDGLESIVPRDIDAWCPAYTQNSPTLRRAFWVDMMSALAKHESTYRPTAVGGAIYGMVCCKSTPILPAAMAVAPVPVRR